MWLADRISPTQNHFMWLERLAIIKYSGNDLTPIASFPHPKQGRNDMLMKNWYRQHNAHVKQSAPKDKLLVFKLADGWEPLCKLLNKPIPSVPFPHLNKGGTAFATSLAQHPVAKKNIKRIHAISRHR